MNRDRYGRAAAGKFYAAILVGANGYAVVACNDTVRVDFGIKELATLSTGEIIPANQKLKPETAQTPQS